VALAIKMKQCAYYGHAPANEKVFQLVDFSVVIFRSV
jgi:hypothetical protein